MLILYLEKHRCYLRRKKTFVKCFESIRVYFPHNDTMFPGSSSTTGKSNLQPFPQPLCLVCLILDFIYIIYIHISEKAMAPHSSTLAWKIPWTEEPGRLQSMGSRRVRHDWATSLSLFTFMHWRRKWQPTPVFLPGESQGQGNLVGCCLWGHTESDTTEAT